MTTRTRIKLHPDAVTAYQRAIALRRATLPVDPIARQLQQQNFYQECEALVLPWIVAGIASPFSILWNQRVFPTSSLVEVPRSWMTGVSPLRSGNNWKS
jgi:hypothetical protein